MPQLITSRSVPGFCTDGAARRDGSWTELLRQRWTRHNAARVLTADLGGRSDRQLADIGLERPAIPGFVRRAIHGV